MSLCVFAKETVWAHSQSTFLILSKVRGKKRIWPHMTSNEPEDRSLGQNYIWIIESGPILEYLEIDSTFLLVLSRKMTSEHFPIAL